MKPERFLYDDIVENGHQSSWDFGADLRFAEFLKDKTAIDAISKAMSSSAPMALRWQAVQLTKMPQKRMYYLRKLVQQRKINASWMGLGEGSVGEFGVNRVRIYSMD